MQNILSKYSSLYLTNQTNQSALKDYFSNPKGVTWEAVLNVQDWSTVGGAIFLKVHLPSLRTYLVNPVLQEALTRNVQHVRKIKKPCSGKKNYAGRQLTSFLTTAGTSRLYPECTHHHQPGAWPASSITFWQ